MAGQNQRTGLRKEGKAGKEKTPGWPEEGRHTKGAQLKKIAAVTRGGSRKKVGKKSAGRSSSSVQRLWIGGHSSELGYSQR